MAPKDFSPTASGDFRPTVADKVSLPAVSSRVVVLFMIIADLVAVGAAFAAGTALSDIARELISGGPGLDRGILGPRTVVMPVLMGLMIGIFSFGGLYTRAGWEGEEMKSIVTGVALIALFDAALAYVTKDYFSRLWFVFTWPLAVLLLVSLRMSLRAHPWVERMMTTHMVLVGVGIDPDEFAYQMRESRSGAVNVIPGLPLGALPTLTLNELEAWLDDLAAREGISPANLQMVIVPSADEAAAAQTLTERMATLRRAFYVTVSYDGLARRGVGLHKVIGSDMVLAGFTPEAMPWIDRLIKRVLDVVITTLGLIVIAPLMLGIMLALVLEGGPVFFSQARVGRFRARFNCLKFRSMRPDAQERLQELLDSDPAAREEWDTHQKLTNDPRITRVGRFLRRTSLDELPQLINVLRGDMSLVGPRPIIAPEVKGYDSDRQYYENEQFRFYARCTPGITGLWQVSGRHRTSHEERVRLDRWYARNWSIWLDLAILFKTFRAVVGRSGG